FVSHFGKSPMRRDPFPGPAHSTCIRVRSSPHIAAPIVPSLGLSTTRQPRQHHRFRGWPYLDGATLHLDAGFPSDATAESSIRFLSWKPTGSCCHGDSNRETSPSVQGRENEQCRKRCNRRSSERGFGCLFRECSGMANGPHVRDIVHSMLIRESCEQPRGNRG